MFGFLRGFGATAAKKKAKRMSVMEQVRKRFGKGMIAPGMAIKMGRRVALKNRNITIDASGTVTVGRPSHVPGATKPHCGCRIIETSVTRKRKDGRRGTPTKRFALVCSTAKSKHGKLLRRFIGAQDVAAVKASGAKKICTHMINLKAKRSSSPFTFKTSHGKTVTMKRKPRMGTMKKNTAAYFAALRARYGKKRGWQMKVPRFAGFDR